MEHILFCFYFMLGPLVVPQSAPLSEYLGALVAGEGGELVGSVGLVLPPVPLQLLTGQEALVTLLALPGELRLLFQRCLCIHEILKIPIRRMIDLHPLYDGC